MYLMPVNYILNILYFTIMLFKKQLRENKKAHIDLAKWSLQQGPRVGIGHKRLRLLVPKSRVALMQTLPGKLTLDSSQGPEHQAVSDLIRGLL